MCACVSPTRGILRAHLLDRVKADARVQVEDGKVDEQVDERDHDRHKVRGNVRPPETPHCIVAQHQHLIPYHTTHAQGADVASEKSAQVLVKRAWGTVCVRALGSLRYPPARSGRAGR